MKERDFPCDEVRCWSRRGPWPSALARPQRRRGGGALAAAGPPFCLCGSFSLIEKRVEAEQKRGGVGLAPSHAGLVRRRRRQDEEGEGGGGAGRRSRSGGARMRGAGAEEEASVGRWWRQRRGGWGYCILWLALLLCGKPGSTTRAAAFISRPSGSTFSHLRRPSLVPLQQQNSRRHHHQHRQSRREDDDGKGVGESRRGRTAGVVNMVLPWRPDLKSLFPKPPSSGPSTKTATIILMAGFEAFNLALYRTAADKISEICPSIRVVVFTDRDVVSQPAVVAAELEKADVFFGSLLFDYDQVVWLKERIDRVPTRLIFESALELMSLTQVGTFTMGGAANGEKQGPPPAVKALLSKFGSKREEDKLKGYLSFLKVGPTILKLVPGKKAQDVRTWLEVYSYWNQGGMENVVSLFLLLAKRFNLVDGAVPDPLRVVETPSQGLVHPLSTTIFESPRRYLEWYLQKARDPANAMASPKAPRVAVLLYRKHVITSQSYIAQLIRTFEREGLLPIPIFINGVEAHTIVRDLLTTKYEMEQRAKGIKVVDSLSREAVEVHAILNTIGFPLVGGPAGSMEAGRRVDVATRLLGAKNVPYFVSSPLLLQDIKSWKDNGVLGLQSAVLYSLPELDGAVDTVVLGGLVGDKIALVPERVRKLACRIKGWNRLSTTPAKDRKISILLYGFPPNVGAIGTAALLNVPRSLENMLKALQEAGFDTGVDASKIDGEAIIAVLTAISQDSVVAGGPQKMSEMVDPTTFGGDEFFERAKVTAKGVSADEFRAAVGDRTADRVEKMWGDLHSYVGLFTSQKGELIVGGLQLGNVWIGVQPLLGIEGDPMRLLFERDLTPHPQYVAFYDWMRKSFGAQAVIHFGMHGTAEWLPGSPLGNTADTWPDILMGDIPNIYIYACNNPSESILAKRRGYGTIVSHNVPAYSRAGLYKDLAQLKELISEYREQPTANKGLRPVIAGILERTGLYEDCPFEGGKLSAEEAEIIEESRFNSYVSSLGTYLGVLEARLFSEGLHVLGERPAAKQLVQYLDAYFDGSVPSEAIEAISTLDTTKSVEDPKVVLDSLMTKLRAMDGFKERMAEELGEGGGGWDVGEPRYHWYNSLSAEEKYCLGLYGFDLLRVYGLKIRRAFGDEVAKRELEEEVAVMMGPEQEKSVLMQAASEKRDGLRSRLIEGIEIKKLLEQNVQELQSVVKALNGEYVLPGVGGDLLRDGIGVLPTGRNIHALDPYRLPSPAAWQRGQEAARKIIEQHLAANAGSYPETVAVMLWGLETIKTRGESVAILLALVGARPVKEATGRVVKYELIPLAELGRPRIDVLASLSGIFRDSFANVVDLLDDLFERAATAPDEPPDMNYIKKHALKLEGQGVDRASARLFSNPAGDYGSLVNERIGNGDWDKEDELGETWQSRNAFSYGRGKEKGLQRNDVLKELLATTNRIVQEIDSVEYGLTDIQEYYANTGALKKAAEINQGGPGKVKVSIIESFSKDPDPKDLEATLRMEYRSKMLNPKWADAMASQGSGGVYEISQRMTALLGWSSTADFKDQFVYKEAAEVYALDPEMARKLATSNPEAFRNIVKRMLEANGRGYWQADEETLAKLRDLYTQTEDEIEMTGGQAAKLPVVRSTTTTATSSSPSSSGSTSSKPVAAVADANKKIR